MELRVAPHLSQRRLTVEVMSLIREILLAGFPCKSLMLCFTYVQCKKEGILMSVN